MFSEAKRGSNFHHLFSCPQQLGPCKPASASRWNEVGIASMASPVITQQPSHSAPGFSMILPRNVPFAGAALLCMALATAGVSTAQSPAPFSREEILAHLRSQVTPYGADWEQHQVDVYKLCELVEQRGVSFTYGEGTPIGFDKEMHSAAGGTTGRSASGQGCNLAFFNCNESPA